MPHSVCFNVRLLYFINSYSGQPAIMTLTTSGQQLQDLINSELNHPSALTIDFQMDGRLFWADEVKNVIESCKADGTDRTIMFTKTAGISCYSRLE